MLSKKCPLCGESPIEWIAVDFTLFRHFGFVDFDQEGMIGRCPMCQLLMNGMPPSREKRLRNIYTSLDYAQGRITNQTYLVKDYDQRVTRSFLQAEILKKYLKNSEGTAVLDIGCFNGELLLELSERLPRAKFHGFDVNPHLRAIFPSKKNFHFWLSELKSVRGEFDLICLSCSIVYIKDIQRLFDHIHRLLKPEGLLFIQINDIASNPYAILLADQYFYFTPRILKNILGKTGFDFTLLETDWFPRDVVGIARLAGKDRSCRFEEDLNIYQSLNHLNAIKKKLQFLANGKPLCVLGTTAIAAFVDSILGDKIHCFVDENRDRTKIHFRGKRVVHPRALDEPYCLILPYGSTNDAIQERFSSDYDLKNFQFI